MKLCTSGSAGRLHVCEHLHNGQMLKPRPIKDRATNCKFKKVVDGFLLYHRYFNDLQLRRLSKVTDFEIGGGHRKNLDFRKSFDLHCSSVGRSQVISEVATALWTKEHELQAWGSISYHLPQDMKALPAMRSWDEYSRSPVTHGKPFTGLRRMCLWAKRPRCSSMVPWPLHPWSGHSADSQKVGGLHIPMKSTGLIQPDAKSSFWNMKII